MFEVPVFLRRSSTEGGILRLPGEHAALATLATSGRQSMGRPSAHPEGHCKTASLPSISWCQKLNGPDSQISRAFARTRAKVCVPEWLCPLRLHVTDCTPHVRIGRLRRRCEHPDIVRSPSGAQTHPESLSCLQSSSVRETN